uniref:SAC domain-containing protein n=1 Tax=Aegilops tauschii TaxID=37682 RepID=N1R008_AEGTA
MDAPKDASPSPKLHTRLRVWEFADRYVFEPVDGLADLFLSISRTNGSMNLVQELPPRGPSANPKVRIVFGVVGVLKLAVGSCCLVITDRDCVGSYMGHAVFKVTGLKFLPCTTASSAEQKKMESEFSDLLDAAERSIGLYFSYEANLTLTLQRLYDLGDTFKALPLWKQAERRFMWNGYLLEPLIENKVRGSMPFLWEQIVDLTYKPSFDIVRVEEAARVLERHYHDLQKKYGAVVGIDLVNTTGGEGRLYERYAKSIEPILSEDIRFIHFDFHKICGHIHFERLSQLYDQIEDYLKKHKYFLLDDQGKKMAGQTGTVRTNCVDCLDRTNVTQPDYMPYLHLIANLMSHISLKSMVGRKTLESQLQQLGVLGGNDTISNHPAFDADYKVLWANHGDAISTQYSGTPALKGDFVRYGKRTTQGILNDLWNALARYYFNNFADGTKQDAMDLLQGHYVSSVSRDAAIPSRPGVMQSFRAAFALIFCAAMFMLMSLRQARNDLRHLVVALVWAGLCVGIALFVKKNATILQKVYTNFYRCIFSVTGCRRSLASLLIVVGVLQVGMSCLSISGEYFGDSASSSSKAKEGKLSFSDMHGMHELPGSYRRKMLRRLGAVKDIMYHIYTTAKESLKIISPSEMKLLKYLLNIEDPEERFSALATAFSPGDEHEVKDEDALYT